MKSLNNFFWSFPLFLILSIFNSCTNQEVYDACIVTNNSFCSLTRSEEFQNDNKVLYSDVLRLVIGLNRKYDEKLNGADLIHCIVDETNDTLLYACDNINGGWILFSSDTRLPAIVMQSNEGSIGSYIQDLNTDVWLKSLIQEMKQFRITRDEDLIFTKEEIDYNKNFWKSISDPNKFLMDNYSVTTTDVSVVPDSIIDPAFLKGHYEYYETYKHEEIYDSSDRMIKTNWSQNEPYNNYCPFKSNSSDRAPAGGEAVVAAQMLYFMNSEFGIPQKAPSEAYCGHHVDDSYVDWAQTNYTETVWKEMQNNGNAAAPLIADIGRRLDMNYGNNESHAIPKDLVKKVFDAYGINCIYKNFDSETLKANLLNNMPVIIEARDKYDSYAHTFIVDRYQRSSVKTTHVYVWVYDGIPDNVRVPYVPDSVKVSYTTPHIINVGINWGNGFSSDQWFPLLGEWRINNSSYNFSENRKMIYINTDGLIRKN